MSTPQSTIDFGTVIHSTKQYSLYQDRFGNYTLRRWQSNGAMSGHSAYFQGDDASLWDRNMEAILKIEAENGWRAGNSLDKSFDYLCSGYDDILEPVHA